MEDSTCLQQDLQPDERAQLLLGHLVKLRVPWECLSKWALGSLKAQLSVLAVGPVLCCLGQPGCADRG